MLLTRYTRFTRVVTQGRGVNAEETPYDDLATEVVREPIGTAVPKIVAELLAA